MTCYSLHKLDVSSVCRKCRSRSAFTLIELLIVLAVVAVLVTAMMPAVMNARESARRTQCRNNLKQLAIATHMFHDTHGAMPAAEVADGWATWIVPILPYVEQRNVASTWDLPRPYYFQDEFDSPLSPMLFRCPSQPRSDASYSDQRYFFGQGLVQGPAFRSDYMGVRSSERIVDNGMIQGSGTTVASFLSPQSRIDAVKLTSAVTLSEVCEKGTSETLMLGERTALPDVLESSALNGDRARSATRRAGTNVPLAKPDDSFFLRMRGFGSHHSEGVMFAYGDGRVQIVSYGVEPETLTRLASSRLTSGR